MEISPEQSCGAGCWSVGVTDDLGREHVIEVRGRGRKFLLSGQRAVWMCYAVQVDGNDEIPQGRLWRTKADAIDAGVRYLLEVQTRDLEARRIG
jgi:hypothetical protein